MESTPHLDAAIERVHGAEWPARLQRAVERGDTMIDSADNPLSAGTWRAARGAVTASLSAVEAAVGGDPAEAMAVVRPPGHHAERDFAMGFCYFANVVISAAHALAELGCRRVAIVDFDVHHGNGTQHLTESRSDIFFASLHQWPFYPGTGAASEVGVGGGLGTVVNVPMPAGTGDDGYLRALDETVLPAVERFEPDLLLASAGFDAWNGDPLGGMALSVGGFARIGERLRSAASRCWRWAPRVLSRRRVRSGGARPVGGELLWRPSDRVTRGLSRLTFFRIYR